MRLQTNLPDALAGDKLLMIVHGQTIAGIDLSQLKPDSVEMRNNLGVALLKLNDAKGARQQFAETLRLDPNNKSARSYLGSVPN